MTPFLQGQTQPTEPALVWPWAANWQTAMSERLEWRTAIKVTQSAKEQRQAQRREPRLYFSFSSLVAGDAVVRLQQALAAWAGRTWAVPAWWAASRLTSTAGDTLALDRATATLWPASGWGLLWSSPTECELVQIDSVGASGLTLTETVAGTWPAGSKVVPLYFATLEDSQQLSAPTAEVVTLATQWAADPSLNTVLPESDTWASVFPDGATAAPRAHFWWGQHNWGQAVDVTTETAVDVFDPGLGGWSRRASRDLPALQWGQRVLLRDDASAARLRQFASARRGAAVGFYAANPVADIRVDTVEDLSVTWAEPLMLPDLFVGVLLRGDVVDFRMLGSALSDATGNHTVTGTGVTVSGGWLDFDATSGLTLSPPLVLDSGHWSIRFDVQEGGFVGIYLDGGQVTYITIYDDGVVFNDPNNVFASANQAGALAGGVQIPPAGEFKLTYRGGVFELSANGVVGATVAPSAPGTCAFATFGKRDINRNALSRSLRNVEATEYNATVTRAATGLTSSGATLTSRLTLSNVTLARLVSPVRLASDALEITHHTAGVAEATLAIRTTLGGLSATGGGGGGGGGGSGGGLTPGLLMHFDGNFVDECRGRSFSLTGGSPPTDALTTDACAGTHALGVGSGEAGSPMPISTSQFPQDFDVGSGGAVTIEYFARTTGWNQAFGVFITFSDASEPVDFIWQVRHSSAEVSAFRYRDPSGNVHDKYRTAHIPAGDGPTTPGPWTHVAFVITPTEARMYVGGVLANHAASPPSLAAPIDPAPTSGVLTVAAHYTVRVDDLRILPQEVYTGSSFTPPTAPLGPTSESQVVLP